jgi:hypothetical protein
LHLPKAQRQIKKKSGKKRKKNPNFCMRVSTRLESCATKFYSVSNYYIKQLFQTFQTEILRKNWKNKKTQRNPIFFVWEPFKGFNLNPKLVNRTSNFFFFAQISFLSVKRPKWSRIPLKKLGFFEHKVNTFIPFEIESKKMWRSG